MFDPMSRSVAGGEWFSVYPVVGEIAQTSEEEKAHAGHIHTLAYTHTHLLSTPVELCGDHQAGSPEG